MHENERPDEHRRDDVAKQTEGEERAIEDLPLTSDESDHVRGGVTGGVDCVDCLSRGK